VRAGENAMARPSRSIAGASVEGSDFVHSGGARRVGGGDAAQAARLRIRHLGVGVSAAGAHQRVRSRERTLILVVLVVLVILVVERQHGRALPPRVRAGGRDGFCLFGLFHEALLSRATLRARGRVVRGFVQRRRLERALPAGERVQSPELVGGDGALAAVRRGVPAGARRGHRGVFDFGFQQRREKRRGASRARAFAPPRRGVRDSDTPAHAAAREDRRRESVACLVGVRAPILAPPFRRSSRERRNTTNGSADVPRCEVLGNAARLRPSES
jgi:hypothetical protein